MKHALGIAAAVALLSTGGGAAAWAATGSTPAPGTVTDVSGDMDHGFTIEHYDGTSLYPPTDSEALAECGEYDRRVERVRCRTQVRTWYRDLAVTQQALDWAHQAS